MKSIIILIVASQGYQPLEYGHTHKALEDAGFEVKVASDKAAQADATPSVAHAKVCDDAACRDVVKNHPEYAAAPVDMPISDIKVENCAGVFLIGGPGALEFLNNQTTYDVMKKVAAANKPFGAICVSPRILAAAGLLKGKKATGWNGDKKLDDVFKKAGVTYLKEPVVTDGNIVTADGPGSATVFGKAIVAVTAK